MPFGDSITVFDCRLNAYTSANDLPVFQPLDSLPAFSCVAVCLPTSGCGPDAAARRCEGDKLLRNVA